MRDKIFFSVRQSADIFITTTFAFIRLVESQNRHSTNPYVKFAGEEAFWNSEGVEASTANVKRGHEEQPAETGLVEASLHSVDGNEMYSRNDCTQTQHDVHS